ncbi:hypothetical protein BJV74DRAFT_532732 [Russula compacta]|nr:hypothetical protein BJV74DRAFT_532732 [Russula compacta]
MLTLLLGLYVFAVLASHTNYTYHRLTIIADILSQGTSFSRRYPHLLATVVAVALPTASVSFGLLLLSSVDVGAEDYGITRIGN